MRRIKKTIKGIFYFVLIIIAVDIISFYQRSDKKSNIPEVKSEDVTKQTSSRINTTAFDYTLIPEYSFEAYTIINNNIPFFQEEEKVAISYEKYSALDSLGRCGVASACIGQDIMPTEERGEIGTIKPSGWKQVKYAGIDGNYLYNRCHLIAFCLAGENANECNLITGTRYMNVVGMLPFEEQVLYYIKNTGNHVLYRVTPIFIDTELLARGVLIEALSVEDDGMGIKFCVFCYNVQPGITIDYMTGLSSGPEFTGSNQ